MNWKNLFKHGLILYGLSLIVGFIFFLVRSRELMVFEYGEELFWLQAIIVSIVIPFVYPFFISKKSWKEVITMALIYVFVSVIVVFPMSSLANKLIVFGYEQRQTLLGEPIMITGELINDVFASNPTSSLLHAICYKYIRSAIFGGKSVQKCFLMTDNPILDNTLLIPMVFTFIVVSISMLIGNFPANLRAKS